MYQWIGLSLKENLHRKPIFPLNMVFPTKKTFKPYLTILKTIFTGNQLKFSQQNQAIECNINSRETSDEFPKIPRFDP